MADITSNLFAWWRFLEGSGGTVADSSGNGRGLTLTNGPTWGTGPFSAAPAVTFDGSNDFGQSTSTLDLSGGSAVTVAAWTKYASAPTSDAAWWEFSTNFNNVSTGFMCWQRDGSNILSANLKGDVGYNQRTHAQPSAATWHHICAVYDKSQTGANETTVYIDGVSTGWTTASSNNNTNNFGNLTLYLLSRAGASAFSAGSLADFRVYNRALVSADAVALAAWTGFLPAFLGDDD